MIEEIADSDDIKDSSHRGSSRSTTSSAAVQARAKAQALKAKFEFTKKEANLRQQERELANALLLLGAEKDYAMAEAEAEVFEAAASEGGNAKVLVQKIYDIHVDRPELGLKRIWAHLDERHGSAEAVEHDLMRRLEEFPKIASRDNEQARVQNDPSFMLADAKAANNRMLQKSAVTVRMTGVKDKAKAPNCPIHNSAHELQDCRSFQEKSHEEKTLFVKDNRLCFKCLRPDHFSRNCKSQVKCETCSKDISP
ncbi:hypothetical protein BSL78_28552 [Apostichopus japonicus]|uniref:CCHC-type domain-containing protein n=1 Tax=Stichopus japonicus TaxID=307972 RepID=A0A2G8JFT9_STIJA|nr:hypothetical protein BSL78_28552 [Apostichopus japonicus]